MLLYGITKWIRAGINRYFLYFPQSALSYTNNMAFLAMKKEIGLCVGLLTSIFIINDCSAEEYKAWVEKMVCGKVSYKITSLCKPSNDSETLNDCKSQIMEISLGNNLQKKNLPNLGKSVANKIKKNGGDVNDLFLVRQACANIDGAPVEVFYYSIGGGSAPYGEAWAAYDSSGNLLDEKDGRFEKAVQYPLERMKTVRSIMPN